MSLVIAACTFTVAAILLWVVVALLWLMGPDSSDDWALEGASGSLLAVILTVAALLAVILTVAAFVLWTAAERAA